MATIEELRAKLESQKKSSDGNIEWKKLPKEKGKEVSFRILPYEYEGKENVAFFYGVHWYMEKVDNVNKFERAICFNEDCPVCSVLDYVRIKYPKSKDGWNEFINDFGRNLVNQRVVFNILDLSDNKVKLLEMSVSFLDWLIELEGNKGIKLTDIDGTKGIMMWRKTDGGAWDKIPIDVPKLSKDKIEEIKDKVVVLEGYFKNMYSEENRQKAEEIAGKLKARAELLVGEVKQTDKIEEIVEEEDVPTFEKEVSSSKPECFGKEYLQKDDCISCPVALECGEVSANE